MGITLKHISHYLSTHLKYRNMTNAFQAFVLASETQAARERFGANFQLCSSFGNIQWKTNRKHHPNRSYV